MMLLMKSSRGGPLNLSIQMLKRDSRQENDYKPDGNVIEFGGKEKVYFGGDIIKASQEVVDHNIHLGWFLENAIDSMMFLTHF
jgi:hypothetical protein